MTKKWIALTAFVALLAAASPITASAAEKTTEQNKRMRLRLYVPSAAGDRKFFTGFDWQQLKMNQKIQLVEMARTGALRLNAVMTLPAEIYVRELDRMFNENPQIRTMELGQAIEGIAIAMKDWDDGTDPDQKIKEITAAAPKKS